MTIHSEFKYSEHSGIATVRHVQDNAQQIADAVAEIRNNGLARKLDDARTELCIPELELFKLKLKYPELNAPDHDIRVRAWKRLIASHEIDAWRVNPRRRAMVGV